MDVCERVNTSERRLFVEQIATVVALRCGRKVDAMWHVPHRLPLSVLTKAMTTDHESERVLNTWADIILQALLVLWRYTALTYTVHMLSILYTVYRAVSCWRLFQFC